MVANEQDIRDLLQWVCWRSEEREGKLTKVPYSPLTGDKASSTDPETWAGYGEAISACEEHGHHGLGFVFTPEDDLCGVDLDKCLDSETGEMEGWAKDIIEELDSYTEISPSGTGFHVLVRGKLPTGRNRKGRFEAYDRDRYLTVTGRHLGGTPKTIEGRQEPLERVVKRMFGSSDAESENGYRANGSAPRNKALTDDEEVIQKALTASNGKKFARLWEGARKSTRAAPRQIWPCAGCCASGLEETQIVSTPSSGAAASTEGSGRGQITATKQ